MKFAAGTYVNMLVMIVLLEMSGLGWPVLCISLGINDRVGQQTLAGGIPHAKMGTRIRCLSVTVDQNTFR